MWVLYGVLPSLLVISLIVGVIVLLVRGRGADGWNIEFPTVLYGYTRAAMLVGLFLAATGGALLIKAGLSEAVSRDFSYDTATYQSYEPVVPGSSTRAPRIIDPSDSALRDDIATGVSLAFVGLTVLAIHAFGAMVLRRRNPAGEAMITRGYNLIGLAVATIGFLGSGAAALNDLLRRYVLGGVFEPWLIKHPGEPAAFALVMLPLALWFGFRIWQEFAMNGAAKTESTASRLNEAYQS